MRTPLILEIIFDIFALLVLMAVAMAIRHIRRSLKSLLFFEAALEARLKLLDLEDTVENEDLS
jgi:hypothetical protein